MDWINLSGLQTYHKKIKEWIESTRYVHPPKHSATEITQDAMNKFVTDEQIKKWDDACTSVQNIDASKITSGVLDIARIPAAALERLVEVPNDTARFALTKTQVQLGDIVKVTDTLKMYKVIDDTKLNQEAGYSVFVAGRAAEVPWSGVTDKPATFTPSTHNHDDRYFTETEVNNKLNEYSLKSHNHSGVYQPVGSYASSVHNHSLSQISIGEMNTAGYIHGLMAPFVPSTKSNKLFGIKPQDITVEYSKDGGQTWLDYGMSDTNKGRLFNQLGSNATLGKATTKELNATQGTNSRLRITITSSSASRYVSINKTYIWFNTTGNTCKCNCQVAKWGSKTTWENIWVDKDISGWSGGNFFNHKSYSLQGTSGTSNENIYAVRYEFWMTKTTPNYGAAYVMYINGYGDNVWHEGNHPFVGNDHLYKWDDNYNMILPSGLQVEGEIQGTVTKAKQDEQGNVIHTSYAKLSHTHNYLPLTGGTISGNLTVTGYTTVPLNGGIKFNTTDGTKWLIHNNSGTEIGLGYTDAKLPVRIYGNSLLVDVDKPVWHSGNFDPNTKANTNHNHDSAYAIKAHNHDTAYSSKTHTHSANDIVQNNLNQFVTAEDKTNWNAKLDANANAVSATKLQTPRKINGIAFDGTKDITIKTLTMDMVELELPSNQKSIKIDNAHPLSQDLWLFVDGVKLIKTKHYTIDNATNTINLVNTYKDITNVEIAIFK